MGSRSASRQVSLLRAGLIGVLRASFLLRPVVYHQSDQFVDLDFGLTPAIYSLELMLHRI
jgi:hypothetical protein